MSLLSMAAELKGAQDNTSKVRADAAIHAEVSTGSEAATAPIDITPEEFELLRKHRNSQVSTIHAGFAPERVFREVPFFGLLDRLIKTIVPKGYGTYAVAVLAFLLGSVEMMGFNIPFVTAPEAPMDGNGAIATIVASGLYFLRRAIK